MIPQIQYVLSDVEIPSTKKKVKIRQMTAREEKILLVAKSDPKGEDILNAVKQVVNNCIIPADLEQIGGIDTLTLFDIEYIFIQIRAISVSNKGKVTFKDADEMAEFELKRLEDPKTPVPADYEHEIDLFKVNVKFNDQPNETTTEQFRIIMQYPSASLLADKKFLESVGKDVYDYFITVCIKEIWEGDRQFLNPRPDPIEIINFINNLPLQVYDKLREYAGNLPTVYYEFSYVNKFGKERKVILNTLSDFFRY